MKKYFKIGFPFAPVDENPAGNDNPSNDEADKAAATSFAPKDGDSDEVKAIKDQNKRLFERAKKAEGFEKQADGSWMKKTKSAPAADPLTTPPKPKDEDVTERIGKLENSEKKRQFGHAHQLSPEETDTLFGFAQGRSISPEDALKDPFFQAGLTETRRAARVSRNTPSSSNGAPKVDGKTFEEMTPEERQKNWPKIVAARQKK